MFNFSSNALISAIVNKFTYTTSDDISSITKRSWLHRSCRNENSHIFCFHSHPFMKLNSVYLSVKGLKVSRNQSYHKKMLYWKSKMAITSWFRETFKKMEKCTSVGGGFLHRHFAKTALFTCFSSILRHGSPLSYIKCAAGKDFFQNSHKKSHFRLNLKLMFLMVLV